MACLKVFAIRRRPVFVSHGCMTRILFNGIDSSPSISFISGVSASSITQNGNASIAMPTPKRPQFFNSCFNAMNGKISSAFDPNADNTSIAER